VHVHLNSVYSDAFLDIDDLFVAATPPTRTNFVPDPVAIIKNKTREESIVLNALNTTDPTAITPLWAR